MSKQKELLVILEEIKERADFALKTERCSDNSLSTTDEALCDVPLLVKALRRAIEALEAHTSTLAYGTIVAITAILNGERPQKEDLEEPGAAI